MSAEHSCARHGHGHAHAHAAHGRPLLLALLLTLGFAVVEAVGGWWSGSLALISDAGHMVSDSLALALAAVAAIVAARPSTSRLSYGFGRVEVIAALINVLIMFGVVFWIFIEAWQRFSQPRAVDGGMVILIAALGLIVNLLVAWVLHRGEKTLNTRAALLHVIGDLLGSVAALASGLVIYLSGWTPIDPLLSFLIGGLILYSSLRMLAETLHLLLEGVPKHLSLEEVGNAMVASSEHVDSVHDLHIWSVSSQRVMLSAHVMIDSFVHWQECRLAIERLLNERYGIEHVTLQPDTVESVVAVTSIRRAG
jgi:cobalt-zinc-cadmium efflux system protein